MTEAAAAPSDVRLSPWAPLRHSVFRALFIAQLTSNIGTLMQSVGSAWLMGDLGASAFLIALVPTASMLPVLLVGLPGGALADIFDRRRLLIGGPLWMMACAAALAVMSFADVVTPASLLALTFGPSFISSINIITNQYFIKIVVCLNKAINESNDAVALLNDANVFLNITMNLLNTTNVFLNNANVFLCVAKGLLNNAKTLLNNTFSFLYKFV